MKESLIDLFFTKNVFYYCFYGYFFFFYQFETYCFFPKYKEVHNDGEESGLKIFNSYKLYA